MKIEVYLTNGTKLILDNVFKIRRISERSNRSIDYPVEYNTWRHMLQRCYEEDHPGYFRYGGRGIKVCQRWLESFDNFLDDVGLKESTDLSLDRIDNDGDYEPGNVRWTSSKIQGSNRSFTARQTYCIYSYPPWFEVRIRGIRYGKFKSLKDAQDCRDKILSK